MKMRAIVLKDAMRSDATMRTRHFEILRAIVREYIETGEPVG
jgi:hypothetical protein